MSRAVEAALRRHRAVSLIALAALAALAWAWLLAGAGMDMAAMGMNPEQAWSQRFATSLAMWWTMMVAMMVPAAAPTVLLYVRAAAHGGARPAAAAFVAGYLLVWGIFSVLAASLQLALERARLVAEATMALDPRWSVAAVLLAAGAYQLSPLKDACLTRCRNPAAFIARHYRPGPQGALRMGLIHGAWCVGCCWLLMALLLVGGVMNLAWIAALSLLVAAEKLLPFGRWVALGTGLLCLAAGLLVAFGALR